ncbi:hypothetical protein QT381_02675 [Galbitalea sp. SE-J8]|uniref:hypothetical protein n=1 Tax=Galbitalea sp. SE-J8 TaxID=3054952 RepID=UPI00259C9B90|nr:hypothetical protein [Galbitalea sp. SE-J8]MDM4761908.1 hypothetical protein [Galbitalea sp. SE-J8]
MSKRHLSLYLVHWYRFEVFKVGVTTTPDRIRKHAATGGVLLQLIEPATTRQEREALRHLAFAFDRAFDSADAAVPVLGSCGLGFTECFKVPNRHVIGAVELASLGVLRGADEENPVDQARVLHQR